MSETAAVAAVGDVEKADAAVLVAAGEAGREGAAAAAVPGAVAVLAAAPAAVPAAAAAPAAAIGLVSAVNGQEEGIAMPHTGKLSWVAARGGRRGLLGRKMKRLCQAREWNVTGQMTFVHSGV